MKKYYVLDTNCFRVLVLYMALKIIRLLLRERRFRSWTQRKILMGRLDIMRVRQQEYWKI